MYASLQSCTSMLSAQTHACASTAIHTYMCGCTYCGYVLYRCRCMAIYVHVYVCTATQFYVRGMDGPVRLRALLYRSVPHPLLTGPARSVALSHSTLRHCGCCAVRILRKQVCVYAHLQPYAVFHTNVHVHAVFHTVTYHATSLQSTTFTISSTPTYIDECRLSLTYALACTKCRRMYTCTACTHLMSHEVRFCPHRVPHHVY